MIAFAAHFVRALRTLRDSDDLPYFKHLRTLELPLGGPASHSEFLVDMIRTRSQCSDLERLSRVVLEVDGVERDRHFQDLIDSLMWMVPEVVVTKVSEDGPRWSVNEI